MPNTMIISSGTPYPFGARPTSSGVNFAIASKYATEITLCLFDSFSKQLLSLPLDSKKHKTGYVWHVHIAEIELPVLYGWKVNGPASPFKKTKFDPEKILLDPHAQAVFSENSWGRETHYPPLLGIVLPPSSFDWEGDMPLNLPLQELIIYEMHVRSFTQHASSRSEHPGTYLGIIEKIPHLLDLGITAVELMPVYEFDECHNPFKDPETGKPLLNVWGYSPLSFFAPMRRFASSSAIASEVEEFKKMVKALHHAGIEVILDVVYNHTGEGGEESPPISFRGIDYLGYYILDANLHPLDFSGCGNTFNCNHPPSKDLIIKSLRYWVTEMHVDGFRFDLASILNRGRHGKPLATSPLVDGISQDPILANTKMIAEPWDAAGMYQVGAFYPQEDRWREWNGKYRDGVRRFINCLGASKGEFASRISGSQDLYSHGRSPQSSINFITAHDGFTLRDLVSYSHKNNIANGEENRDGTQDNNSWNCGEEGESKDPAIEELRQKQIRNFLATLLISQGIPMLLMGDEYGHTKKGNNNTYCQDNELNWFLWDQLAEAKGLFRFAKEIIALRKKHACFKKTKFLTEKDISWHGQEPMYQEWDSSDPVLAFTLYDHQEQKHLYIAYNMRDEKVEMTLPPPPEGFFWHRIADTSLASPDDISEEKDSQIYDKESYEMASHSLLIMKAFP